MKKPALVILAAGMGSRYGGLKQIDPVDPQGHIIMDFSIYDALEAGFDKVVFIIKKATEAVFKESIGDRVAEKVQVEYTSLPPAESILSAQLKICDCRSAQRATFAALHSGMAFTSFLNIPSPEQGASTRILSK